MLLMAESEEENTDLRHYWRFEAKGRDVGAERGLGSNLVLHLFGKLRK